VVQRDNGSRRLYGMTKFKPTSIALARLKIARIGKKYCEIICGIGIKKSQKGSGIICGI
jgi:hypothetical protein